MAIIGRKYAVNFLLISLFSFIFISCANKNKKYKIVEIFYGVEVVDDGYIYSEGSNFKVDENNKYSLRHKAIYGEDGIIIKFIIYKPEGILNYTNDDLIKDKKILVNFGIPFSQKWTYMNNQLIDDNGKYITKAKKIDKLLLMVKKQGVIFYKLKE